MTPLEETKIRFEIAEKALIVLTLVIAIGASAYKGYKLLSAKSEEAQKKAEAIEELTKSYTQSIKEINDEIRATDLQMAQAPWKGSYDWDKYAFIREAKAKDRALILERLGAQIVDLKRAEK